MYIESSYHQYMINENITKLNANFKKWFGKSKVLDKGKPMICYHGSHKGDITEFDIGKIGTGSGNMGHYGYGIYFSTDIKEAKGYGQHMYRCYIRIENPFSGTEQQMIELKKAGVDGLDEIEPVAIKFESLKAGIKKIDPIIYKALLSYEKEGKRSGDWEDAWSKSWEVIHASDPEEETYDRMQVVGDAMEYLDIVGYRYTVDEYILDELKGIGINVDFEEGFRIDQSLHWITDLGNKSEQVSKVIKKLGYDGVWYGSELVMFDSNQIKSLDNDGSFDKKDNNIYS